MNIYKLEQIENKIKYINENFESTPFNKREKLMDELETMLFKLVVDEVNVCKQCGLKQPKFNYFKSKKMFVHNKCGYIIPANQLLNNFDFEKWNLEDFSKTFSKIQDWHWLIF